MNAKHGRVESVIKLEERLDDTVIKLWGVTPPELELVKQALSDLGPLRQDDVAEEAGEDGS